MSLDVVRCRGAFGFVETPLAFTFRVYPDGDLLVNVVPVKQKPPPSHSKGRRGRQGPTAAPDFVAWRYEHGDDDEQVQYSVVGGRARKDDSPARSAAARGAPCFQVEFTLVCWLRSHVERAVMKCTARLSTVDGVAGSYVGFSSYADSMDNMIRSAFSMPTSRKSTVEPLTRQLFPLTPGRYELQGCTTGDNGYMYVECTVNMTLLPDGTLCGETHEAFVPEGSEIMGSWTRNRLRYTMQYETEREICTYEYSGAPRLAGARGGWHMANPETQDTLSENGTFEYRLVRSNRVWSKQVHLEYPKVFQQIAKLLLLSSLRAPEASARALPSAIWFEILSFCDYGWFGHDPNAFWLCS